MAWYFEYPIQCFSAVFYVLIKILESYRPQISHDAVTMARMREHHGRFILSRLAPSDSIVTDNARVFMEIRSGHI